jgi:hypothetical protein
MPRELTGKNTSSGLNERSGTGTSSRSQKGTATSTDDGVTTQSGESVKTGESRQFANVAMRISFAIKIKGRVPTNSPC